MFFTFRCSSISRSMVFFGLAGWTGSSAVKIWDFLFLSFLPISQKSAKISTQGGCVGVEGLTEIRRVDWTKFKRGARVTLGSAWMPHADWSRRISPCDVKTATMSPRSRWPLGLGGTGTLQPRFWAWFVKSKGQQISNGNVWKLVEIFYTFRIVDKNGGRR